MRRLAVITRLLLALALCVPAAVRANEIEVREAALRAADDGLLLDADFAFELTPRLAEVVANGVPLYFGVEFELTHRRTFWFDERTASRRMQVRLSYHPLSRHYRLSTGLLQQNFASLEEALNVLKRVRSWLVVDRTTSLSGDDYEAAVRMRLDASMLPKPFQLSALTSRELQLESAWRRFTVRALQQAPAPVETRHPQAGEAK
jgi:hypothetical protein